MKYKNILFFCLLSVTFSYFHQGGGFNQNATLGEIRELVENHTVEITKWVPITGDISHFGDKSYSNKSPSLLFLVAPVYFGIYQGASLLGVDTTTTTYQLVVTHLLTFLCSGLWAVLLGMLYLKLIPKLFPDISESDCYGCAYLFTVGTLAFPYSGVAFVHNFETFCVLHVFYRLVILQESRSQQALDHLALCSGLMMLANPITVLSMPVIYLLCWRQSKFFKPLVRFSLVALVPLLPLFLYNHLVFGFFLSGNRNHMDPIWTDPALFMGVFGSPQLWRLGNIFGLGHRSILTIMPFLSFGILGGLGLLIKLRDQAFLPRKYLAFSGSIVAIFLMLILTFNGWHGGTGLGPRYFIPALPFLALPSIPFFIRFKPIYLLLACWSLLVMLVASSASIWVSEFDHQPLLSILNKFDGLPALEWPSFLGAQPPFNRYNLGHILGFPGYWSLAPLVCLHVLIMAIIINKPLVFSHKVVANLSWNLGLKIAGGIVGFLALSRLANLNLTPFINDEAQIQLKVSKVLLGGRLALVGLSGSQPIPYGPIPIWIYTSIRFFYDHHYAILLGHTLTHVLALWLFFRVQLKVFTPKIALLTTAFAASSPFLFNYARLPWDNTFLFLFSIGMVFYVSRIVQTKGQSNGSWFGLGAFSGCAISTHLMVLPLVVSSYTIAIVYSEFWNHGKIAFKLALRKMSLSLLGIGVVSLPYFKAILPIVFSSGFQRPASLGHGGGLDQWTTILEQMTRFLSYPGFIGYFLRGNETEVVESLSYALRFFNKLDGTWLLKLPVLLVLSYPIGLVLSFQWKRLRTLDPMFLYCSLTGVLAFSFYALSGHYSHPHYYNYLWWMPMMAVGFLVTSNWVIPSQFALGLVSIVLAMNLGFVVQVGRYLGQNEGTRGLGWGASAENQQRLVREICADLKNKNHFGVEAGSEQKVLVDISKVTILPHSLDYFTQHEPQCKGVPLEFTNQGTYVLGYASADKPPRARLQFEGRL